MFVGFTSRTLPYVSLLLFVSVIRIYAIPPPGVNTYDYKYQWILASAGDYHPSNPTYIGEGGILKNSIDGIDLYGGSITSTTGTLTIKHVTSIHSLTVFSDVRDNPNGHNVGLKIVGSGGNYNSGGVYLFGSRKSFTGDTVVENGGRLVIAGDSSIQSRRIYLNKGGLELWNSNALRDDAFVSLSNSSRIYFGAHFSIQRLSSLYVYGEGTLDFGYVGDWKTEELYLDDLVIGWGSELTLHQSGPGTARLLVRKDSKNLRNSLSRIRSDSDSRWRADLRDFNKDYWVVWGSVPEPSVYGAIFGALGLVLVAVRKRTGNSRRIILPCKSEF